MRKSGIKTPTCEELVLKHHTCEKLLPIYHTYKKLVLDLTDVSDKTVKNWNRMQNAADKGVFYQCEEYACILYRAYFSLSVRYWSEICDVLVLFFTCCEELVPIIHSVKFTKCEVCDST